MTTRGRNQATHTYMFSMTLPRAAVVISTTRTCTHFSHHTSALLRIPLHHEVLSHDYDEHSLTYQPRTHPFHSPKRLNLQNNCNYSLWKINIWRLTNAAINYCNYFSSVVNYCNILGTKNKFCCKNLQLFPLWLAIIVMYKCD